jgi:hypothetical protein
MVNKKNEPLVADRSTKVLDEFDKLRDMIVDKVKEMLDRGLLRSKDLEYDYEEDGMLATASFNVTYPDGSSDVVHVDVPIDIVITVREPESDC